MAWYDRILGRDVQDQEKLNPAQSFIGMDEGMTIDTREIKDNYRSAYEELEVVNRAVNMIVDDSADIKYDVGNENDFVEKEREQISDMENLPVKHAYLVFCVYKRCYCPVNITLYGGMVRLAR